MYCTIATKGASPVWAVKTALCYAHCCIVALSYHAPRMNALKNALSRTRRSKMDSCLWRKCRRQIFIAHLLQVHLDLCQIGVWGKYQHHAFPLLSAVDICTADTIHSTVSPGIRTTKIQQEGSLLTVQFARKISLLKLELGWLSRTMEEI